MNNFEKLQAAHLSGRLPQAILCVGSLMHPIVECSLLLTQMLLCQKNEKDPCKICNDCYMVERLEHPDMEWIKPEKSGGVVKIDQIRALQQTAYLTPQRARYRIVVIEAADKMNTASANALLKILEEPPSHTVFILIAQQLSTVLPTVLSRCQLFRFIASDETYSNNLLLLGETYPEGSEQALILKDAELILNGLIALIAGREHPCVLASTLTRFSMSTFLWFYYLILAQVQQMQCNPSVPLGLGQEQLLKLSTVLNPLLIFSQLDKINNLLRKLSHNITINHVLALEDLLLDLGES